MVKNAAIGEIILNYLSGPNINKRVRIGGKKEGESQARRCDDNWINARQRDGGKEGGWGGREPARERGRSLLKCIITNCIHI